MFESPKSHLTSINFEYLFSAGGGPVKTALTPHRLTGLGYQPFTLEIRVRVPLGSLKMHSAIYFLYILSELQKGSGSNPDDSPLWGSWCNGSTKKDASWICLYSSVGKSAPLIRERSLVQIQFQVLAGKSNGRSLAS